MPTPIAPVLHAVALDVGRARIGLAVTSPRGDQALPHSVLQRKGTRQDIASLQIVFAQLRPDVIVVGLPPAQLGDTEGSRGLTLRFADALRHSQPRPVVLVDEADTTVLAGQELRQLGMRAARRRTVIDAHAAKVILDRWLLQVLPAPNALPDP